MLAVPSLNFRDAIVNDVHSWHENGNIRVCDVGLSSVNVHDADVARYAQADEIAVP